MPKVEFVDKPDDDALRVVRLGYEMVAEVIKGRAPEAVVMFAEAVQAYPDMVATLVSAWCHAYIDHSTNGAQTRGVQRLVEVTDVTTGHTTDAADTDLPAPTAWASKVIMSTVRGDEDEFARLWGELPMPHWTEYVLQVLDIVGLTILNTQRGYALVPHVNLN